MGRFVNIRHRQMNLKKNSPKKTFLELFIFFLGGGFTRGGSPDIMKN